MSLAQEKYDKLIANFQRKCATWKTLNPIIDFVFNNDLRGISIDSLEYIFIGDNHKNYWNNFKRFSRK